MRPMKPRTSSVMALLLTAALVPATAAAQSAARDPIEAYGTFAAGQVFLDEGYPDHLEFGGGARLFLTPRLGVQGELLVFRSNIDYLRRDHRLIAYGHVVGTWGSPAGRLRPYWLGGISVRTRGVGNTAVWPSGGVGLRYFFGRRCFVAPEVRCPIFRASVSVGTALGR